MAAAAAPSLADAAGVGGSSLPVIPKITSGGSSRIQAEEVRPVVIRNIYKPKFMVKTPTTDFNYFTLDVIEPTEEYAKWTAPEVAQDVAPMILSEWLPYYIIGVKDDGWCMYRAWAYAHSNEGKRSSPIMAGAIFPEISEMQLWRLAHGMVAKMKEKRYKPEGMVVIDGKSGAPKKDATGAIVKGWPTQYGANAGEDHIDVDGTPRRFTTDLYDGLLTLYDPNDISKGPLVWPTQDMIRYLDMLLPNAITFVYQPPPPPDDRSSPPPQQYRNFWDMYRNTNTCKDGHLCGLKPPVKLYPANMAPRGVIPNALILFNGKNHYDVLKLDIPVGTAEPVLLKTYGDSILKLFESQRSGVFIDKSNIDYLISDAALTGPYRVKDKVDAARDAISREYNLGPIPLSPLATSPPLSPHSIDMSLLADAAQALLTGAQNLHGMSAGAPAAPNLYEQIAALPNTTWNTLAEALASLSSAPQAAVPTGLIDTVRSYIKQATESITAIKVLEKIMPAQIINIRVAAENAYRTLEGILTNLQSTSPTATLTDADAALQQVLDAHAKADAAVSAALAASVAAFPVIPTGVPAAPAAAAVPFDRTQYLTIARVAEASALSSAVRARAAAQRINSDQARAMAAEVLERAKAAIAAKQAVEAATNFVDADVNARAADKAANDALAGANALEGLAAPAPASGAAAAGGGGLDAARAKIATATELKEAKDTLNQINERAQDAHARATGALEGVSEEIKGAVAGDLAEADRQAGIAAAATLAGSDPKATLVDVQEQIAIVTDAAKAAEAAAGRVIKKRDAAIAAAEEAAAEATRVAEAARIEAEAAAKRAEAEVEQRRLAEEAAKALQSALAAHRLNASAAVKRAQAAAKQAADNLTAIQEIQAVAADLLEQATVGNTAAQQHLTDAASAAATTTAADDINIVAEKAVAATAAATAAETAAGQVRGALEQARVVQRQAWATAAAEVQRQAEAAAEAQRQAAAAEEAQRKAAAAAEEAQRKAATAAAAQRQAVAAAGGGAPAASASTAAPSSVLDRIGSGLGSLGAKIGAATAGRAPLPQRRAPGTTLPPMPDSVLRSINPLTVPRAAVAPAAQPGVAGIFVLDVSNNLFVHKRGTEGPYAGKLGIPMGDVSGEDYATAAIRELAEEAQLTPPPTPAALTLIYTTTLKGKSAKFYLYRPAAGFTIAGPDAAHVAEVAKPFPVADVSGVPINAAFAPAGYIGVKPTDLLQFLNGAGAPLATDFMKAALAVLQRYTTTGQLTLGAQPMEVPEGDIPQWASGYFDVASLRDCSGGGDFIGPECASRAIFRDIMVAEEFKKTGRLAVRPNSGAQAYNKLVAEIEALRADGTDPGALKTKESQMEKDYGDIPLWITDPATGVPRVLPLPNPYRAMASREQATTFANPSGGAFSAKNVAVLTSLVGPKGKQMLEDSKFATSLLEALWFCGQGHVMNDNARCYPAMVLAELREQEAAAAQRSAGEIAKELKWPLVMDWGWKLLAEFKGVKAAHAAMEPAPIAGPAAPAAAGGSASPAATGAGGAGSGAPAASGAAAAVGGTKPAVAPFYRVARGIGQW